MKFKYGECDQQVARFIVGDHVQSLDSFQVQYFFNLFGDDANASIATSRGSKVLTVSLEIGADCERWIAAL